MMIQLFKSDDLEPSMLRYAGASQVFTVYTTVYTKDIATLGVSLEYRTAIRCY